MDRIDQILKFHVLGNWREEQVRIRRVQQTRPRVAEIEVMIEQAWKQAKARPGVNLFDGPMCRLEKWEQGTSELLLELSETTYSAFLGTNLNHPELADRYGEAALANPVGVSPALVTADGYVLMGRRNDSVAYYPRRIHPFAGALDPADASVFEAVRRELWEELHLRAEDLVEVRCTGIAEDRSIRQPELIFSARTLRTRAEVEARLDQAEHVGVWACPATREGVETALESAEEFTPVAVAALVMWGRGEFLEGWFEENCATKNV